MTGRLPPFVALSLLLHGLMLAVLAGGTRDTAGRLSGMQWLPVTLAQPAASTGHRTPAMTTEAQQNRASAIASPQPPSDAAENTTAATDASAQPDIEAAGTRLQQALHRALLPYFYYPLLARAQGWQGEALFAVHVTADGQLSRLHLMRSSGHAVLDRAALDSLGRIRTLPEALHHDLGTQGMTLRIPVVYKLTES
jgi:protein TonB